MTSETSEKAIFVYFTCYLLLSSNSTARSAGPGSLTFKPGLHDNFFWHGTRLNLVPVLKIVGPAPSIFVV